MEFRNLITGALVTPEAWQLALTVGDYYEVAAPVAAVSGDAGFEVFAAPPVYGVIEEATPKPGFFYVRGYSEWCPDGESGLFNICEATKQLTKDEFEAARSRGWRAAD